MLNGRYAHHIEKKKNESFECDMSERQFYCVNALQIAHTIDWYHKQQQQYECNIQMQKKKERDNNNKTTTTNYNYKE